MLNTNFEKADGLGISFTNHTIENQREEKFGKTTKILWNRIIINVWNLFEIWIAWHNNKEEIVKLQCHKTQNERWTKQIYFVGTCCRKWRGSLENLLTVFTIFVFLNDCYSIFIIVIDSLDLKSEFMDSYCTFLKNSKMYVVF